MHSLVFLSLLVDHANAFISIWRDHHTANKVVRRVSHQQIDLDVLRLFWTGSRTLLPISFCLHNDTPGNIQTQKSNRPGFVLKIKRYLFTSICSTWWSNRTPLQFHSPTLNYRRRIPFTDWRPRSRQKQNCKSRPYLQLSARLLQRLIRKSKQVLLARRAKKKKTHLEWSHPISGEGLHPIQSTK